MYLNLVASERRGLYDYAKQYFSLNKQLKICRKKTIFFCEQFYFYVNI